MPRSSGLPIYVAVKPVGVEWGGEPSEGSVGKRAPAVSVGGGPSGLYDPVFSPCSWPNGQQPGGKGQVRMSWAPVSCGGVCRDWPRGLL